MGNEVISAVAGLQLSNSTFSASPPGSMSRATNIVINNKGVAEPRRGQAWASTMPAAADIPFSLAEFQSFIIASYGTSKTDTSQALGYVNSGSISAYSGGPYNPVGDNGVAADYMRMKFCLASLFLHFACTSGPKCLETYNGTPRDAGVPPALGGFAEGMSLTSTPVGFLSYDTSVAYRITVKRVASSGVPRIGAPGERILASNRISVPVGGMVRTGGNLVTVTLPVYESLLQIPGLGMGDTFILSPGEADFPAGTYTITSAPGLTPTTFTFTSAGGNVSSTVVEEMKPSDAGGAAPIGTAVNTLLPYGAQAGDIVQAWRSVATSSSSIEPSDDLYLVAEHTVTAGEVVAGIVHIYDSTPESVLSKPLYTNSSDGDGLGLPGENLPPPIYGDAANFDGQTWYCNTLGQQTMALEILGTGGPDGIQDGDTFTIADGIITKTLTFKTTLTGPLQSYAVTDGTPSENIAATAQTFVAVMNLNTKSHGISFDVTSGATDVPGKILIRRTDYGPRFGITVSRPASWTPALDPTTPTYSSDGAQANGLVNSKTQEPEAVPPTNYRTVGTPNFYARRIFGLRNALIILKEGDGIWSLTGSGGNYNLQQISTANTIAPVCACVFADNVWAYTDQGILRISDTGGIQVISRPIETALNELAIALPSETYASSFAVAYEVERRVMFFLPFAAATAATGGQPLMKAYCYSNATNAWTGSLKFNETPFSGIVSNEKHLWLGAYDGVFSQGRITEERKTGTYLDNAEAQWSNTLTTTANPLVVALATAGAIRQGSGISQTVNGTTYQTKIAAVNGDGTYTLAETFPWANAACTIYDPYEIEPQFLPQSDPVTRKSLTRLASLFKQGAFANYYGSTTIETDQIQATLEIATPFVGYGLTPYGQGPYGNPTPMVVNTNPIDAKWSSAAQFFPGFLLDEVWCRFKLQGMAMTTLAAEAPSNRGA